MNANDFHPVHGEKFITSDGSVVFSTFPDDSLPLEVISSDEDLDGVHICGVLKLEVLEDFNGEGGQGFLDYLIQCPSDYEWKDGGPGSASDIFLRLLKDRMTDSPIILHDLDAEVRQSLPG
jgi:hypothetical protein